MPELLFSWSHHYANKLNKKRLESHIHPKNIQMKTKTLPAQKQALPQLHRWRNVKVIWQHKSNSFFKWVFNFVKHNMPGKNKKVMDLGR